MFGRLRRKKNYNSDLIRVIDRIRQYMIEG